MCIIYIDIDIDIDRFLESCSSHPMLYTIYTCWYLRATSISKHIKKWKKCLGSQRRFCGICYFSSTLPKKTPFNLLATDQNSEALTREVASFLGSSHFIGSPVYVTSCHKKSLPSGLPNEVQFSMKSAQDLQRQSVMQCPKRGTKRKHVSVSMVRSPAMVRLPSHYHLTYDYHVSMVRSPSKTHSRWGVAG